MYCEKCGRQLEPGSAPCPGCGHRQAVTGSNALGIASLVLAIIGLNIAAIVTGVIALQQKRPGRDMALVGVIIAGARIVLGVFVAILFAGLMMLGLFVSAVEQKSAHRPPRRPGSTLEELWEQDDSELNIDTTIAARAEMFTAEFDPRLDRLEARADSLILAHPDDEDRAEAIRAVRLDIGMARNSLARMRDAATWDELMELMTRAERLHDEASAALARLESDVP